MSIHNNIPLNIPPKPLDRKINFNFKTPIFFQMDNGLNIIIQNDKCPIIKIMLEMDIIPITEGKKAGIQRVIGNMLRAGTEDYTKRELDYNLDYMGIDLWTSFTDIYMDTLKKYLDKSIHILRNIVMQCKLNNEQEFKKIIKQIITDLICTEKNSSFLLQRIRNVLFFGKNHPYGEYETVNTVKSITINDIKKLYNNYYAPNNFYLSFIGDVHEKEIIKLCNLYFSDWKMKKIIEDKVDMVLPPISKEMSIYLLDLPFLTQSNICFGGPILLKPNDNYQIASEIANGILGEGGQSRLFLNIREKKAYTYSTYSVLVSDRDVGYFEAITKSRNKSTHNVIYDILYEINKMTTEKVKLEELESKKNEIIGQFIINCENPSKIVELFIAEIKNELESGFYQNFLHNVKSVTRDDVYISCNKFFKHNNIIIVGNKKSILSYIKKLRYPIYDIDNYGYIIKNV